MMSEFSIRKTNWQDDANTLRTIREQVFIDEQHVPVELEWDGEDEQAIHWLVFDSEQHPVATARLLGNGHLGRMAVLADYRGKGVGTALLLAIIREARDKGMPRLFLNAQVSALAFYEKQGFIAEGDIFDDAGIPHRRMQRKA